MKKTDQKASQIIAILSDASIPAEQRKEALHLAIHNGLPDSPTILGEIIEALERSEAHANYKKILADLKSGPLRGGIYLSCSRDAETGPHTAEIILDDGQKVYSLMPEEMSPDSMKRGDRILLDGRGQVVLRKAGESSRIGEEAVLERVLDQGRVELTIRDGERSIYLCTSDLEAKIAAGEVSPGDTFVINPRQLMALDVLPPSKGKNHYRFLCDEPVPDVIASRDIGNPSPVIEELGQHLLIEMTDPAIRREYRLPRCHMQMLIGVSGCGKTQTIEAIWRRLYEVMSKVTGIPIEQLPRRVFRLKSGTVLSEWFGKSERQIEAFFDEVNQLSAQKWVAPDGRAFDLPVLVIAEEADGLARHRGGDQVYDRVLTTLLQRLDPNRPELRDRLIFCVGTSNLGTHIDSAFMRRLGSNIEKFSRLDRNGFRKVLHKQIAQLPIDHSRGGMPAHDAVVADITSWLFSRNGSDPGVLELTYAGSTTPDVRYRRDFLTGALVYRAVVDASKQAANDAYKGLNGSGLHLEQLVAALDQQILAAADQVSTHNAATIVDIPEGVRVANVKRLPQPSQFPLQLQSN